MKFVLIAVLLSACYSALAQKPGEGLTIKKVSAHDVKAIIDTSKGPLIVNFWASWCSPCIHEIPWFDSIIAQRNAPVKLLLVSLDFKSDYPQKLSDFVRKQGYKGEVVFLNDTRSDIYIPAIDSNWAGGIPASIFVDHSKGYYHIYNQQLPKQQFAIELDKLINSK